MSVRVSIEDRQVDETFLELTLEDLWDLVKRVRRRSGKREERYTLTFGATMVEITVRRVSP